MSRFFPNAKRSLDSLFNLFTDLLADGLLFFCLLFRSRTALSAEVLFLRKQLAFYQERQVQPRRLNDSARFSLILLSRLCNWKDALVIVKPETLIGWHRKGFKLFWKWKSQAGRPRLPENIRTHRANGTRESDLGTSACGRGTIGEVGHLCLST
jgi:putative transposase